MDYDLLIDLGTGSTRAALVDSSGRILSIPEDDAYGAGNKSF